ncbi:MAG: translesion DNA synthesis-associated protein ImuA [Rubrivivax sp.]|nr:MAG: translesion DNA synthesis-associated protein ImuA [Rubrivivax sp.]
MDSLGLWPLALLEADASSARHAPTSPDPARWNLPRAVEAALWRADHLSRPTQHTCSTGFGALDQELPGGGWPTHSLTEVLQQPAQPGHPLAEWRLLLPGLRRMVKRGLPLVLIGPPLPPHAPGLQQAGIDVSELVWVQAQSVNERLWATEQMIKGPGAAGGLGSVLAWLPQAQAAQIRRLQTWALHCQAPVFVMRPARVREDASAAPLRVMVRLDDASTLKVSLLKRRGPVHESEIALQAWPPGLDTWARQRAAAASRPAFMPVPHPPPSVQAPVPAIPAPSIPSPQETRHALAVTDPLSH